MRCSRFKRMASRISKQSRGKDIVFTIVGALLFIFIFVLIAHEMIESTNSMYASSIDLSTSSYIYYDEHQDDQIQDADI